MRCSSRFSTYHLNVRSVERSGNNLYAACAQFEGLGGKLRETELRGPNCDKDKERLNRQEITPGPSRTPKKSSGSPGVRTSRQTQARVSLLHAVDESITKFLQ